jgi:hypothetical protein
MIISPRGRINLRDGREFFLRLDKLPPAALSPNSRVHWAKKYYATATYRQEVGWLAKSLWGASPPIERARIVYHFFIGRGRRARDLDNLIASFKAGLDGLVDAGVIRADDSDHLSRSTGIIERAPVDKVEILIRESLDATP